jgi:Protein of unknown function (DUF3105)
MASRAEEKERRRQERIAQEEAQRNAAARLRRLQLAGGALLGVAAVVAIVLVVAGGGSNSSGAGGPSPTGDASSGVKLPVRKQTDLTKAAAAAGCVLKSFPLYGREHTTSTVHYQTNPPTSGNHNPNPADDGYYPNGAPPPERYVHSLEHGRIETQWKPGTPKRVVDTLVALFNEPLKGKSGYHELLFENNTGMPFQVAVASWQHYLGCPKWNANVIDAIRDYRETYVDKGPEFIP